MTRYFGVLANRHALRPRIVPDDHAHDDEPKQLALFLPRNDHELAAITQPLRDEQLRDRPPARRPRHNLHPPDEPLDVRPHCSPTWPGYTTSP
jgi:hypothetical protein